MAILGQTLPNTKKQTFINQARLFSLKRLLIIQKIEIPPEQPKNFLILYIIKDKNNVNTTENKKKYVYSVVSWIQTRQTK